MAARFDLRHAQRFIIKSNHTVATAEVAAKPTASAAAEGNTTTVS